MQVNHKVNILIILFVILLDFREKLTFLFISYSIANVLESSKCTHQDFLLHDILSIGYDSDSIIMSGLANRKCILEIS